MKVFFFVLLIFLVLVLIVLLVILVRISQRLKTAEEQITHLIRQQTIDNAKKGA